MLILFVIIIVLLILKHFKNKQNTIECEIVNSINLYIWTIDKNFNLIYSNKLFKRDIIIEQIVDNKNILTLASGDEEYIFWKELYQQGFTQKYFNSVIHVRDSTYTISMQSHNDVLICVMENIDNITKQKQIVENKNKVLEEFAYIVTHDLKTPLRGINGIFNILKERLKKLEKFDDLIPLLESNIYRLNEVVEDTTAYTRIGNELDKVETNVKSLINKHIKTNTHIAETNTKVINKLEDFDFSFDIKQFSQLLTNLISNAIKFNSKKNKIIEIGVIKESDIIVGFYIRDNGDGFKQEYSDKIFNMFQRLDVTKKGTGLGLAIVKRVVDNHNWEIKVKSIVNKGTIFSIYMKLIRYDTTENTHNR